MTDIRLLIVEDSDDDALLIARQFKRAGVPVEFERAETGEAVAAVLRTRPPDVVISDYNMPAFSAEEALRLLRETDLDLPFILVSGEVGEEAATALMKAGAHDFVLKDRLARLVPAVQRELREAAERRQRRQAEAALRDSEERFRLLAEHAEDIIFRYRLLPTPAVEYVSPAIATIVGYQSHELYADPDLVFRLVEPADRAAFEESWRSPDPQPLTVRWHRRDGRLAWTEQRAVGICDDDGRLIAVEGILREITDQVIADQERERLERQLRQAERLESLGQLAGGIAHDFNNLLAVVAGYADMIAEALPTQDPLHADLEGIRQAAIRGAALTRQLLIFSRREPSRPETLDLNGIVVETTRLLSRTLGEDVQVVTTLDPSLRQVTIDRSKIEQVLMNLVVNSRAAMPHGGVLAIQTVNLDAAQASHFDLAAPADDMVCLSVADTGFGMPPEVARRAFEPFFTTKGPGEGTGLGLATAYGAVKEAGGAITLESEPDQGTTVRVCLPAACRPQPAEARERTNGSGGDPDSSGRGETVLVVEDEDAVREVVRRILSNAGYRVHEMSSPTEALAFFEGEPHVDVMLTDVIMPGMSGTQLAARIRQTRPDLPVLFMSGYTTGPAPGGQELPPDASLIRKPFDTPTLLRRLREVLSVAA